jgi:predicted DNA-binding ribbon-helix-helix protein
MENMSNDKRAAVIETIMDELREMSERDRVTITGIIRRLAERNKRAVGKLARENTHTIMRAVAVATVCALAA